MNKIKRSLRLLKTAFAVMLREKKLLLFPFVATGLALVVAAFFLTSIALYPTGHSIFSTEHWGALVARVGDCFNVKPDQHGHYGMQGGQMQMLASHPAAAAFFAVAYFVSMFLATFSNVAFYHEIMQALNGDSVSIRRGYRFAASRWRAVLLWSLFAGLVGYIIQTIQERLGIFGRIVTGLIGFVWSAACIFIIPTLVRDAETHNPFKLLHNSVGTLRRTWGEMIVGFVGIGIISGLAMFTMVIGILVAIGIPMVALSAPNSGLNLHHLWYLSAGIVLVAVIAATILSYLAGLINSIYRCALYIYAIEGVVPESFDKELLDSAWKVK
jgi:hypothetical protein